MIWVAVTPVVVLPEAGDTAGAGGRPPDGAVVVGPLDAAVVVAPAAAVVDEALAAVVAVLGLFLLLLHAASSAKYAGLGNRRLAFSWANATVSNHVSRATTTPGFRCTAGPAAAC